MTKLLIDGYNLLFASPFVGKGRGPRWLESARNRLLMHLRSKLDAEWLGRTVVVFDARPQPFQRRDDALTAEAPTVPSGEANLRVLFASEHDDADELIETMIQTHPTPKQLIVVSGDQRIRRKALARNAISWDAESFLDRLEAGKLFTTNGASSSQELAWEDEKAGMGPLDEESVDRWKQIFDEDA